MTVEDAAWLFLLLVLIDNSFTGRIEFLHIFVEHRQRVENNTRMLVLCIVDEGKDKIDTLPHAWNQLPCGLQSFLGVSVRPFQLFYLPVVEFIADDRVTAHLRHQKHHTLDLTI